MFADRVDAGRQLAVRVREGLDTLPADATTPDRVLVVGLPRGGVPVAVEVGQAIGAPVDVIVVRKLGVPWHRELAMGAIGENGARVINDDVVRIARVSAADLAKVEQAERSELARRGTMFRGPNAALPMVGKTVVVVDDGLATGATARAACQVARAHGAARVVLAVPVAPPDWIERLGDAADDYVCVASPPYFSAVGQFYRNFDAVSDEDVVACLERSRSLPT